MGQNISDIHLFYKDKDNNSQINSELDQFYQEDEKAIIARHVDEFRASSQEGAYHLARLKTLEEELSSFSNENPIDEYGKAKLLHKSTLLHNIGSIRASKVSQDVYNVKVEPRSSLSEEVVVDLNIVLKEMMLKADFDYNIKELITDSRFSTFSAMLIDYKKPELPGKNEDISQNRVEIIQLDPKKILWDVSATNIESCQYIYDLSKMGWFEIINDPFLGQKKDMLNYVYENIVKGNIKEKTKIPDNVSQDVFNNIRNDNNASQTNITLQRKWVIKNKGAKDQVCWIQYFIGENIFLGQHKAHSSIIPIVILKEFNEPNSFYGSSKVTQLLGKVNIYNNLIRAQDRQSLSNVSNILAVSKKTGLDEQDVDYLINKESNPCLILDVDENMPLQNYITTINVNQLNSEALAQRSKMKEEILQEAGITGINSGDTNSMQTKSALGRASSQTTLEMKPTLLNIKNAVKRATSIFINYITNSVKDLEKDNEVEIKKYSTDPKSKGKQEYEFVKINFKKFKDIKVDIIPFIGLNPELGRQEQLDIFTQLLNLNAQGNLNLDLSFIIEGLLKDMPFAQDIQRDIYLNKKENLTKITEQVQKQTMDYIDDQADDRTPEQFASDQGQLVTDAMNSPAGVDPLEVMQGQQQGQGQQAENIPGIDNKNIL